MCSVAFGSVPAIRSERSRGAGASNCPAKIPVGCVIFGIGDKGSRCIPSTVEHADGLANQNRLAQSFDPAFRPMKFGQNDPIKIGQRGGVLTAGGNAGDAGRAQHIKAIARKGYCRNDRPRRGCQRYGSRRFYGRGRDDLGVVAALVLDHQSVLGQTVGRNNFDPPFQLEQGRNRCAIGFDIAARTLDTDGHDILLCLA